MMLRLRALIAALALGALTACGSGAEPTPTQGEPPSQTRLPSGIESPGRTVAPSVRPSPNAKPSPARTPSLVAGRYQPLWPFATAAEARAWQLGYRDGGHQPWHLDADETALAFTLSYLGFKNVNVAVGHVIDGIHARVSVGYRQDEGDRPGVAAVIHLVRFGAGKDAPWEVVGTDDRTFSLTKPAYGSAITSPALVGGRITGVDESIRITVHQKWSESPIGRYCCLPAGGTNAPWSAKVSFHGTPGQVMTIVAATGGHVAEVERFAVTGVTPAD